MIIRQLVKRLCLTIRLAVQNIAMGYDALYRNTMANENIAIGNNAMFNNLTAGQNIAIGVLALSTQSFNPGSPWSSRNVAVGYEALYSNQATSSANGVNNTAIGHSALRSNTIGYGNTSSGKTHFIPIPRATTILLPDLNRYIQIPPGHKMSHWDQFALFQYNRRV
jgi:hypothetical protein